MAADRNPWSALERLARNADHAVLVAPYIKEDSLRRVLRLLSEPVHLICVTRWQRRDIIAGASDVTCRTLVVDKGGRFLLNQRLHAKYFRFGDSVLVGSANLTAAGMGYGATFNLEILQEPGLGFDSAEFEKELLGGARDLTDPEFEHWKQLERVATAATAAPQPEDPNGWRPMTREPAHVWLTYCGDEATVVSEEERHRATLDLQSLNLPPDLDSRGFDTIVGTELLSSAAIADVLRTSGLPDEIAWTQLAEKWTTTRREAQRFRETAWNWIATVLSDIPQK